MDDQVYQLGTWKEYVERRWPWTSRPEFSLEAGRTMLVIVDMTRYQCDPEASWGVARTLREKDAVAARYYFERLETVVVPAIRRLLHFFHDAEIPVVFSTSGPYRPDLSTEARQRRSSNRADIIAAQQRGEKDLHPQFEIIPQLAVHDDDIVIHKMTTSLFMSTPLDLVLRDMQFNTVVITGAATHACVDSTARSAVDLGYNTVLVDDACVAQMPLLHEVVMMKYHLSGRVLNADQVISELQASPAEKSLIDA